MRRAKLCMPFKMPMFYQQHPPVFRPKSPAVVMFALPGKACAVLPFVTGPCDDRSSLSASIAVLIALLSALLGKAEALDILD